MTASTNPVQSLPLAENPTRRSSPEEISASAARLRNAPLLYELLNAMPDPAAVLNANFQLVGANRALLDMANSVELDAVLGKRLGELLGCIHATEIAGGCGTTETCRQCGALCSLNAAQKLNHAVRNEARMLTGNDGEGGAAEFDILVTPFELGEVLYLLAAKPKHDERRREVLERLFFHDALNVATGIQGLAELLLEGDGDLSNHVMGLARIRTLSDQLVEQICAQRDLGAAERLDLKPIVHNVEIDELFDRLEAGFVAHPAALRCVLRFAGAREIMIRSDRVLLERVMGNLIKNALEASQPGQVVTVRCHPLDANHIRLSVHNETAMSDNVRAQVFQRSFSTKPGAGRGLGTFSVKLLTTRYLGGSVEFCSDPEFGTVFSIRLPRFLDGAPKPGATLASGPSEARLNGERILLVDDSPDNQRILGHFLRRAGALVTTADDAVGAFDALWDKHGTAQFDVVLLDLNMPGIDGYQAAKTIRARGFTGRLIALTAATTPPEIAAAHRAGCDGFLAKPVTRSQLVVGLQELLKQTGAADD